MPLLNVTQYHWSEADFPIDRCRGQNKKKTLVLILKSDFVQNAPLLKRILSSVGCELDTDVSVVTMEEDEKIPIISSVEMKNFERTIIFGIPLENVGPRNIEKRTLLKFENLTMVLSRTLEHLKTDDASKRRLWTDLKTCFNVG